MRQIKGSIPIEGIKRCHVGGVKFSMECPNCSNNLETCLAENYLSYPKIGENDVITFYCENCDDSNDHDPEHEVAIFLKSANIIIEYDENKINPA